MSKDDLLSSDSDYHEIEEQEIPFWEKINIFMIFLFIKLNILYYII